MLHCKHHLVVVYLLLEVLENQCLPKMYYLVQLFTLQVVWQENLFQELQNQSLFEIEFMDDLPNFELIESKENICFVIDDMMQESSNSNQVASLLTRKDT